MRAFRKTGLYPPDPKWADQNTHLFPRAVAFDTGPPLAAEDVLLLQPSEAGGSTKQQRSLSHCFVAQTFTPSAVNDFINHPNFEKAMKSAAAEVGMCPMLVAHAVKTGAQVAAAVHAGFVPVTRPVGTASKVSDGRARTILGESKSSAKVLNEAGRMEKLRAHLDQQAATSEAEKARAQKRAKAF